MPDRVRQATKAVFSPASRDTSRPAGYLFIPVSPPHDLWEKLAFRQHKDNDVPPLRPLPSTEMVGAGDIVVKKTPHGKHLAWRNVLLLAKDHGT